MKIYYLICLFSLLTFSNLNAQNSIDDKISEVYGNLNGDFFKGNTNLYFHFYNLLEKRIKIEEMKHDANEKFTKLSVNGMNNKYNSSLIHTEFENIQKFNPLKYNLDFFAKTTKIYRIDNTDYILIIDPQ